MKSKLLFPVLFMVLLLMFSTGVIAQTYVGSQACATCHGDKHTDWMASGHPYKFTVIENNEAPTYPDFVTNFQDDWMANLGDGSHGWDDIAGVIGGFGWKSRFVGPDGIIIGTASSQFPDAGGGHNQFNFFGGVDHGWSNYNASTANKAYNYGCFKCHTTGGTQDGTWLDGVDGLGNFSEGGIGCESCHGPGSDHVAGPTAANIDRVYEFAHLDNTLGGLELDGTVIMPDANSDNVNFLCGTCHNRSYTDPINSSGGFIRHHEQWDEFVSQEHFKKGFTCTTCHDPHKRVLWDGEGIKMQCATCHPGQAAKINHAGVADCIDCHMPFAAKSGTTRGMSGYKGDVRSHIVAITPNTESMFTEDGSAVKDDETRSASLSPAFSCLGCHNDSPLDVIADMTLEEAAVIAKNMHAEPTGDPTFVTSIVCKSCHTDQYNDWHYSGHPYKFTKVMNGQPPVYPDFVENFQDDWMANLGDGSHGWDDIAGVIGGFGWKSRFVGPDGIIIGTASSQFPDAGGGHNQFNFFGGVDHGWVDYSAGSTNKAYNYGCFKCHTTGGTQDGTWLDGVDGLGNFSEGGIGCESCHGPGSHHVQTGGDKQYIDKVYEYAHLDNALGGLEIDGTVVTPDAESNDVNFLCGTCHNRSYTDPINSSGGFIKHHEQWDEFVATTHYGRGFTCTTCHDPHKRVIWDGDGVTMQCETCHTDQAATVNHSGGLTCIDCHMPYAAKSGTTRGASGYKGDVRSHLMVITPDTESMFTEDGSAVRDDETRKASLSPAFSCLGCHNDDPNDAIFDKTLEAAAAASVGMHTPTAVSTSIATIPTKYALDQNYPNPFNPTTKISFALPEASKVNLTIYTIQGQRIKTLIDHRMPAGSHSYDLDARELPSGIYIYTLTTENFSATKRMTLLK